ncbi:prolipoprotein diacylglyceryl transferase [Macrococcus armenti]|uniref:prolipoprotein diacylglyceryl transferase n=1 Tax=Macrococcus armenti TaxID=2875764 RepID=UPI001CCF29CF|nr:prolipoprotein diacylglyceryl transferase [Macrococcus armenti]UBH09177.1 prolipoprotein diacylglyceryl transferase [Macrococcus armenti]UBH11472.1 prolipoprotein diacylglyceryl transferase [Macrococcus armenti]UBH15953.1 prolipoprotein diacylglyceryl transferase [Macrococcus armenti]UBH18314.1 prolipoprotein diacylglyceryl transferase [Macrococcus armenti]UBH20580.1 prolipoprotein diacylglyceryl transferase [Macrococcus armenti]
MAPFDPTAFEIFGYPVRWYGIIIACGILIGYIIAQKETERKHFKDDTLIDIVMWSIVSGIICARIYYVAFKWDYYYNHVSEIPLIMNGGIAIHGGLIGAIGMAYFLCRRKNISFFQLGDIAAPSIILGQAIGRWGNFMNQEAHGGEVTRKFLESLHLPEFIINQMNIDGTYYHPTFLYESVWSIIGFIILLFLRNYLKIGQTFLLYGIWYSIGRFFVEGLRTDSLMLTSHLRIAQVISIVIMLVAAAVWIYRNYKYQLPKYGAVNTPVRSAHYAKDRAL